MDSVATSGVVATMTRKPRDGVASVGEAVVTDLSGNGKKCDLHESAGGKKDDTAQLHTDTVRLGMAYRARIEFHCNRNAQITQSGSAHKDKPHFPQHLTAQ